MEDIKVQFISFCCYCYEANMLISGFFSLDFFFNVITNSGLKTLILNVPESQIKSSGISWTRIWNLDMLLVALQKYLSLYLYILPRNV